jgi:proline dehydrogenase
LPVAITVQAYLHRSPQDLARLVENGAMVRLVKGAFAEKKERSWTSKAAICRAYLRAAAQLLSATAREHGVYPVFATHDHTLIRAITTTIRAQGWSAGSYEFEMLYGVRPALQDELVEEGHTVRLYLPFGTEWWPYAARRIGENPANILFVARALRTALLGR